MQEIINQQTATDSLVSGPQVVRDTVRAVTAKPVSADTLQTISPIVAPDTAETVTTQPIRQVQALTPKPVEQKRVTVKKTIGLQEEVRKLQTQKLVDTTKTDSTVAEISHFQLPRRENQKFNSKPQAIWHTTADTAKTGESLAFKSKHLRSTEFNWTLPIMLVSILVLLSLKFYYQKFVTRVVNTLVNFQLAENMLREKNIIVRRAFFMMNLIFVLVLSLFILLLAKRFDVLYFNSSFHNYLLILGLVTGILIIRLALLYAIAFIFEWMPAVIAHIHSNYLVNKNLGLVLLPIVFAAIFTSPMLSKILVYTGVILIILATLFKIIRAFQIIIKNGVLLFYAILYLCTLELLPLALGIKVFTLLR